MSTRVLLLAGGQSEEHEISLTSARCVLEALGPSELSLSVRVITRSGTVLPEADSLEALRLGAVPEGLAGAPLEALLPAARACDVVFALLHGPMGEDGTMQGLLTLAGVPFVGSGVLGSALCMDKPMAKEVLRAAGLPQVEFLTFTAQALNASPDAHAEAVARIQAELRGPWFVKPANMGSSVGISCVRDAEKLGAAMAHAQRFDRRILVEAGLPGVRELEVAVLGNADPSASCVGEICHDGTFYDYETKYTAGHSRMQIPAEVPEHVAERARALALQAYTLLDCAGLARIDFFYEPERQALWINEINTLPGFTSFSMFPTLWARSGLPYAALIERLVALALERHAEGRRAGAQATKGRE
jgi:D-alanine-D-alanine ligase